MRAIIQLVKQASVTVEDKTIGQIGQGLLVLLGVGKTDTDEDAGYLADKITGLRIFPDDNALMNRSLLDVGGEMLVVSQFTLYGDCRKGRRPSFNQAGPPELANQLYEVFCQKVRGKNIEVATGRFQAMMQVSLVNDGPVTIILDSEQTRRKA